MMSTTVVGRFMNLSKFARPLLVVLCVVCVHASYLHAAVNFYVDDAAGFNAATSSGFSLAGTEDWESSTLSASSVTPIDDPLAPGVANGPFLTGTVVATGLTVQSNTLGGNPVNPSPRGTDGLGNTSTGLAGTPSDQMGVWFAGDSFDMLFGLADTLAVTFTPLVSDAVSSGDAGTATIRVFDTSNNLIGTAVDVPVAGFKNPTTTIGIVATGGDSIGRINIDATSTGDDYTGADNISVYIAVPEPLSAAPLAVGSVALLRHRRSKR